MELGVVENLHRQLAVKQDVASTSDLVQGYHPLVRILRAQLFDDLDGGLVLVVVHAHGGNFHPSRFSSRLVGVIISGTRIPFHLKSRSATFISVTGSMIIIIQFNLRIKIDNLVIMDCSACYCRLSRTCENMSLAGLELSGVG
jgi:hypothetical protein